MVQSLNKTAELTTQGISYLGMGAKYGHFLIGDQAFEFLMKIMSLITSKFRGLMLKLFMHKSARIILGVVSG